MSVGTEDDRGLWTIMAGSGLKEMFSVIYAGNSVDKILSGHAYARAVRGHSLAYAALGTVIIEVLGIRGEDLHTLDAVVDPSSKDGEEEALRDVTYKFGEVLKAVENRGRTAALWVQYLRMCALMKNFIRAERSGDWDLHLASVKEMIAYFHAAGHLNYAKSAHLYYQDAINLKDKMDPEEFTNFTKKGYFTIRRTDKFWSGVWSDMTIEQVLMRAMKSYGGLTRGRGVTESVLSRWIVGMLCLQSINEQMEVSIGVRTETSEQHVDRRPSRAARDNLDIKKLGDWLADHPPFLETEELLSIGTGAVAPDGVNCYLARSVGISSMKKCLEQDNFHDLKLKRKDKVVTLASSTCTLKIKNKKFTVDPLTLFQRICLTKQTDADLRGIFKYELSPFPMSLFTEEGMHKGKKSALYEEFIPVQDVNFGESKCAVIDGGYLLHKVVWSKSTEATFELICQSYINYVKRHFGSKVIVVFDGYPIGINYQSTKAAERYRRSLQHSSTKFVFTKATTSSTITQAKFLANDTNKKNFISLLMTEMETNGIAVKQATEDADVMIVETAIKQASTFDSVTITGEDIDLLVLLTGLGSSLNNVYFEKSGRGGKSSVLYSSRSFKYDSENILFLHAISGCDTTSAPFGIGKKKAVQVLEKNPWLSDIVTIFKDPEATPNQISDAGEQFLVKMYGGNVEVDDLDGLRYRSFQSVLAKPKFQLARLPPTRDAAKYHSYRAYLQVQTWLGYAGKHQKIPSAWGWSLTKRGFVELSFNGSEGIWSDGTVYSNISFAFPDGFSGIVQLVEIQEVEYIYLQLDLHSPSMVDNPFSILMTRIPFEIQHASVRSIRPFSQPMEQDPCHNPDISLKCRILIENVKIDTKPKANTLELAITDKWTDPLKLELYGRPCHSSCDEPHPPCPTNLTVIGWTNPMTELSINRLVASNYCARAVFSVKGHDCCAIYTRTVAVQYVQWIPHTEHNFHLSYFFYYMFVFLVLVMLLTILLYCRTTKRAIRAMSIRSKESIRARNEPTQLAMLREDEPSIVDIFLVYPHRGGQFMNLMSTFRDLLREYSKKVWDPLEDREVENVIANPAKWMQGVLMIPDVKIVLVETMEAIQWYKSDLRTVDIDERDLYIPVISFLHNQPDLIYDYRRLHVVRFDKIRSEDDLLLNIVPQKRYKMPYQLGLLIRDLTNCLGDAFETENNSPALHRFYKATEDYESSHVHA